LPANVQNAMKEAFNTAINEIGSGADATTYWNAFIEACQQAGDDAKEILAEVVTSLEDNWSSSISSIVGAE